jgi:hypothetical protein
LTDWSSKKQQIVALSTCESELISYTERTQSARFTQMLISELAGYEPTAVIFEDNAGCIFKLETRERVVVRNTLL